jgi:hypothetical protein
VDSLVLTLAELTFLLPESTTATRRLRIDRAGTGAEIKASGLSSLAARGLLADVNGEIFARDEVGSVIRSLATADSWVEFGVATSASAGGLQIFDGPTGRVRATAEVFGTFRFERLHQDVSLAAAACELTLTILADDAATVAVFLVVERDHAGTRTLAARRVATEQLQLANDVDEPIRQVSVDEVARAVRAMWAA